MDCKIQSHELDKLLTVKAEHLSKVPTPILGGVDGSHSLAVLVGVAVNCGSDYWQLGDQVHGVFIGMLKPNIELKSELYSRFF